MDRIGSQTEDQAGRLEYLLHFLRDENPRCRGMEIPDDGEGRSILVDGDIGEVLRDLEEA